MKLAGIYVHIPFCLRKCFYCDFYSIASNDPYMRKGYTRALLKEIGFYGAKYGKEFKADSIFFGGGTPSLMEPELMEKILRALKRNFFIAQDSEITLECNPATLTEEKLIKYRKMGINRLSIGAQSFDDDILKKLGRVHNAEDITKTFEMARKTGFDNINLDLMFAVPGQNLTKWKSSLNKALRLKPEHISLYSLEISDNTVFGRMRKAGELKETDVEKDRRMYHTALEIIDKAGYNHYEISNASLKGKECRHNLKYWNLSEYMGLGAGAHSFMKNVRYANIIGVERYSYTMWSQDAASNIRICESDAFGADCVGTGKVNSYMDNVSEYTFTALRTKQGVVFDDFTKRLQNEFWDIYALQRAEFEMFVRDGYAESDGRHIALTRKGIDISNRIMSLFV